MYIFVEIDYFKTRWQVLNEMEDEWNTMHNFKMNSQYSERNRCIYEYNFKRQDESREC